MSVRGLKLRGNTWWLIVQVDGKVVRKSLKIPKENKKEAKQVLREFWLAVGRGQLGLTKPNPPLELVFKNYLKAKGSAVTKKWYEQLARYFSLVITELGVSHYLDLDPAHFKMWLDAMPQRRTAREIQTAVRAAFREAHAIGLVDENTIEKIPLVKHRRKVREPLTQTEFRAFAQEAQQHTSKYLLMFLLKTGARFSEASKALWRQVDLKSGVFTLSAEQTKSKRGRKIGLSSDMVLMLEKLKKGKKPLDLVFATSTGTQFDASHVRKAVLSIGKRIGRSDICIHTLRHSFTSLIRDAEDVSLQEIGKTLGHTTEAVSKIYDHPTAERQRKLAEKLPDFRFLIA
ncbi:tyrosine-type recombinase/integrase [Planctomycetota bacterium]